VETPLPQRLFVFACENVAHAAIRIHPFSGLDLLHSIIRQAYRGGLEVAFLLAGY